MLIGFAQGLAIIPGISRSGATISTGLFSGMGQFSAARLSFILSIPSIIGASLYRWFSVEVGELSLGFEAVTGFTCSFVAGYLALIFLLRTLGHGKFYRFG